MIPSWSDRQRCWRRRAVDGGGDLSTEQTVGLTAERRAIEAILMVTGEPVAASVLAELLEISGEKVASICEQMARDYEEEARGFVLEHVAGGYRFQSHPEMFEVVQSFAREAPAPKLSAAALETLAIVAYRQPVTRSQISEIRGVSGDGVLRMLLQKGYVEPAGRAPGPGQAVLYATTKHFLERMGLGSLEDLHPAGALVPSTDVLAAMEEELRSVGGSMDRLGRSKSASASGRGDVALGETSSTGEAALGDTSNSNSNSQ